MSYQPLDSSKSPRFAQISTFARLPVKKDLVNVDVAFLGIPFDDATTFRPGARFGPSAVRESSRLIRPYNQSLSISPFKEFNVIDFGDVDVVPGYIEDTFAKIEKVMDELVRNGVFPLVCGGDHSITLPILRSLKKKFGKMGLVHFDAHSDCWNEYFGRKYNHGTTFRRAAEEGLIEPSTSLQIGIRGPLFTEDDVKAVRSLGFEIITTDAISEKGVSDTISAIHERVKSPVYVSLDIDCVDPAFAPGTGVPEAGGLSSREIITLVRGLRGIDAVGFDLVEVAPPYDNSSITSILASNLLFEFLSTLALGRKRKQRS